MEALVVVQYVALAAALLGSPGPGIIALLAVGKAEGLGQGLRYYGGLQVGLALGAGAAAAGMLALLQLWPAVFLGMTAIACAYLVYLGWRIAAAPVGTAGAAAPGRAFSAKSGLILGLANPKALPAFASLFASTRLVAGQPTLDIVAKWLICVAVMIVVDLAWLLAGVALGRASLHPAAERWFNLLCGTALIGAAVSLVPLKLLTKSGGSIQSLLDPLAALWRFV